MALLRLRQIPWREFRRDHRIACNALMLLFYSITLTFLVQWIADFVDEHTFPNLSGMIAYCTILVAIYFGIVGFLGAIETSSSKQVVRWLWLPLVVAIVLVVAIYARSIWRIPEFTTADVSVPQSLSQAAYMFVMVGFAGAMCFILGKEYLTYLPLEKVPVIRLRVIATIICAFTGVAYFLARIALIGGYFWPFIDSQSLLDLSLVLFCFCVLTWIVVLLNHPIYARSVMISSNVQRWGEFRDLKYLTELLMQLCPEVAISAKNPSFWAFLLNPEYHLYCRIVFIMDSKAMLGDFLSKQEIPGEPTLWDGQLLQEALRVNRTLQSIKTSDDFWEIVGAYRCASKNLFRNPSSSPEATSL